MTDAGREKLEKSSRPAALSFYGSFHMREFPPSEYWLDPDGDHRVEIVDWWNWRAMDKRVTGEGYQPTRDEESEEWWRERHPYPFDLIPQQGEPVFPVRTLRERDFDQPLVAEALRRGHFNAFFAEFRSEYFFTYPDLPEIWVGEEVEIEAGEEERARSSFAEALSYLEEGLKYVEAYDRDLPCAG